MHMDLFTDFVSHLGETPRLSIFIKNNMQSEHISRWRIALNPKINCNRLLKRIFHNTQGKILEIKSLHVPQATSSTLHGNTSYKLKSFGDILIYTCRRVCSESILAQCIIPGVGCVMHM